MLKMIWDHHSLLYRSAGDHVYVGIKALSKQIHYLIAETFQELASFLQELADKPYNAEQSEILEKSNILISATECNDLLAKFIKELGMSDSTRLDMLLETIIEQNGGTASLNRILVDLYQETKKSGTVSV